MNNLLDLTIEELFQSPEVNLPDSENALWGEGRVAVEDLLPVKLEGQIVRKLEAADMLGVAKVVGTGLEMSGSRIARLRDSHHQIARMIAKGKGPIEIEAVLGIQVSRIKILKQDPTFQQLLVFYQGCIEEVAADLTERYKAVVATAIAELGERIETEPESLTNMQLLQVIEKIGDRVGMAPVQKLDARIQHGVSDDVIEKIKNASAGIQKGKVINGQARELTPSPSDSTPSLSFQSSTTSLREFQTERNRGQGKEL